MIKGRYFFWIPFFCYLVYLVYPTIIQYKEGLIEGITILNYILIVLSCVAFFVYLTISEYGKEEMREDLIKFKILFLLIPYIYIILGINYIFDKYLTINK